MRKVKEKVIVGEKTMYYIRPAEKNDVEELNRVAYESEAYWGYDLEYMKRFEEIYRITEDYIIANPTFVFLETNRIIGFYSLLVHDNKPELELFYIKPQYIGKGYGKEMWNHLIDYCKRMDIKFFYLVTSPQAKGFYEKMGAVVIDEVDSLLREGRKIPRLKFEVF
ncbi:GNAT family N-acetyltransferase [Acetivibrio clariflavus]|uniref:GNAT family N-acetyltransferase n=1 Tax=Acetivibrio clariflavus TaxID=288965 RepID=UPI0004B385E1|nr:GNAT family N-acetyltransferase [Acetivibrio clariflavus]